MDQEDIDGDPEKLTQNMLDHLVDHCTLCDLCHRIKCPYVEPHPWAIDLPRLLLRYRTLRQQQKGFSLRTFSGKAMARIDSYGSLVGFMAPLVNFLMDKQWFRYFLEKTAPLHHGARVPDFRGPFFHPKLQEKPHDYKNQPLRNLDSQGEKIALFGGCLEHYYKISPGGSCGQKNSSCGGLCHEEEPLKSQKTCCKKKSEKFSSCCNEKFLEKSTDKPWFSHEDNLSLSALGLLNFLGIKATYVYPGCCGMPLVEQGLLKEAQKKAIDTAKGLDHYHSVFALGPSCALMITKEWPELCPQSPIVNIVSKKTQDVHFVIAKGLLKGLKEKKFSENTLGSSPIKIFYHAPCHERVQYHGLPVFDLLSFMFPQDVFLLERCSGHGGAWGYNHQEEALEAGNKTLKNVLEQDNPVLVTTPCPLALKHFQDILKDTPHCVIPPLLLLHGLFCQKL